MTPTQQLEALTWFRCAGKWWFKGELGAWPRLIAGDSKKALLPLAQAMSEGRA